jgi:hypothetical protein
VRPNDVDMPLSDNVIKICNVDVSFWTHFRAEGVHCRIVSTHPTLILFQNLE